MSKCVHCGHSYLNHDSSRGNQCPKIAGEVFIGWHPSNRFTPSPIPSMTASEQIFGETAERAALPVGALGKTLHAVEKCADREVSTCPPGCLPFDLAKALAGEKLVTRDGRKAHSCRYCQTSSDCILVEIEGYGTFHYSFNGRSLGPDGADHHLDLFLAAKEEKTCPHCHGDGWLHVLGGLEPCDICQPEAFTKFHRNNSPPIPYPPPAIEARRQAQEELHAIHAEMAAMEKVCEELDRQLEVMRAFYGGAKMEIRHRNFSGDDEWVKVVKPPAEFRFNWEDFDHRIRPASPAPPRRVWVAVDTLGVLLHRTCTENSDDLIGYSAAEFIELIPKVRAKLAMGGEK